MLNVIIVSLIAFFAAFVFSAVGVFLYNNCGHYFEAYVIAITIGGCFALRGALIEYTSDID